MSIQRFKVALNNAEMPLVSTKAQRAVFIPGLDAAPRTPRIFMGADTSADYNMAQVIYAENVMPAAEGIKSVGYGTLIAGVAEETTFNTVFPLRDENENYVLYSPAKDKNYVHDPATNLWSSLGDLEAIHSKTLHADCSPETAVVTYAYVDGKTFVCYARMKSDAAEPEDMSLLQWDAAAKTLVPATTVINLPFSVGEIDGISSSSGYLIIWSGLTIAWAPFNGAAFDFQIYASGAFTGAGFQIPEDIQAPITAIIGMSGGFVAFTKRNAIAASYHAQSIASPWVFREVPDAGGLESYEQATVEGSLSRLVAYTSAGMQTISLNSAELVHPEVADFITGRQTEKYNFATHTLQRGYASVDLFVKVTSIGNRYVVVSYGYYPGVYSYALVWDIGLKRWGKLRIKHVDCFTYVYDAAAQPATYSMMLDVLYSEVSTTAYADMSVANSTITAAQNAMAFMKLNGEVVLATWSERPEVEDQAVAIIGRVQLTRSRNVQLNRIEADGMYAGKVFIQSSSSGRNIDFVHTPVEVERTPNYLAAGCMVDCKNFNIVLEGAFDLSTVILEAIPTGQV